MFVRGDWGTPVPTEIKSSKTEPLNVENLGTDLRSASIIAAKSTADASFDFDAPSKAGRLMVVSIRSTTKIALVDYFSNWGMTVEAVSNARDALREAARFRPSIIVYQVELEHPDGLAPLSALRDRFDIPLIVTAKGTNSLIDAAEMFDAGADDFLPEPFSQRELLARIRAAFRRRYRFHFCSEQHEHMRYRFGQWSLRLGDHNITGSDGRAVKLTKAEYALLIAFLKAPMTALSREHLICATRVNGDCFDRAVDVTIGRLRRKLEADANSPGIILTVRGVGYVLSLPVETT
jgi:two-component system, OmpR family, response regulator